MTVSKLSLQALEVFQVVARNGALQDTARELDMSISAVSHHLGRLEQELGLALIDRSHRPMSLTPAGLNFLRRVERGLREIRLAQSETAIQGLLSIGDLSIGIVEDFENTVAPELAVTLSRVMPNARLKLRTEPSHVQLELLRQRRLDIAIGTEHFELVEDVSVNSLARDPFVLAVPAQVNWQAEDYLAGRTGLPFLRFNARHVIGRMVEAHLQRNRLDLAHRYEIDSTQSILALIANKAGWTITTPICCLRAERFRQDVRLWPLPVPEFTRQLSLFARSDTSDTTIEAITGIVRRLIKSEAIQPLVAGDPWLRGKLDVTTS